MTYYFTLIIYSYNSTHHYSGLKELLITGVIILFSEIHQVLKNSLSLFIFLMLKMYEVFSRNLGRFCNFYLWSLARLNLEI